MALEIEAGIEEAMLAAHDKIRHGKGLLDPMDRRQGEEYGP